MCPEDSFNPNEFDYSMLSVPIIEGQFVGSQPLNVDLAFGSLGSTAEDIETMAVALSACYFIA